MPIRALNLYKGDRRVGEFLIGLRFLDFRTTQSNPGPNPDPTRTQPDWVGFWVGVLDLALGPGLGLGYNLSD